MFEMRAAFGDNASVVWVLVGSRYRDNAPEKPWMTTIHYYHRTVELERGTAKQRAVLEAKSSSTTVIFQCLNHRADSLSDIILTS